MSDKPTLDKVSKHTLTLADGVYGALQISAERANLEPNDLIRDLILDRVIADGTLDEKTTKQVQTYKWLVVEAVKLAKQMCSDGTVKPSLTADVFEALAQNKDWAEQYEFYVQDNMYKSGNPRKGPINREIGYRVRAAVGAAVEKDANGVTAIRKPTGLIIQTYTPFVPGPAKL